MCELEAPRLSHWEFGIESNLGLQLIEGGLKWAREAEVTARVGLSHSSLTPLPGLLGVPGFAS